MHRYSKIFLSHTFSDNNPIKNRLITDLGNLKGIMLWRAESELNLGDSISEMISQAISESDYFIQIIGERQGTWTKLEYELAIASEITTQNIKLIKAIVGGINGGDPLLGKGARGIVLNFTGDYNEAFKLLCEVIEVNPSDSLIKFNLDIIVEAKPVLIVTNEVNEKLIDYFSKHPEQLKAINRRLFEELIAELFLGFGYKVELTQKTRDGGRDIIAIKSIEAESKYLIECKRPNQGNIVGIKPVRELFGVKQDEGATKAILVTTSYFSKDALQFFERNKWELEPKDFDGLMNWIELYRKVKNST